MVNQNSINLLLGTISVVAIILAVIAILRKSKDNFAVCDNNCQSGNYTGGAQPPNTMNYGTGNVPVVAKDSLSLLATDSNGNLSTVTVMPIGSIIMWPSSTTIPDGWFWCDGGTYTLGGTTVDGKTVGGTQITTPDMRGRFIVGADLYVNGGPQTLTSKYNLGDLGGEEMHTLTIPELPAHSHPATTTAITFGDSSVGYNGGDNGITTSSVSVGNTGGDIPHNNLPPFFAIGFIIKLSHY